MSSDGSTISVARFGFFEFPAPVLAYLRERGHDDLALTRYAQRVPDDLAGMAPWISGHCGAIWDIGCGLGGLTALICAGYPVGLFKLTDGDGSAGRKVGYCDGTKGWFDVAISRAFVEANRTDFFRVDAALEQRDPWAAGQVQLVYSLKSWGHHYPVETYLADVRYALAPTGRLIIDIRTGTNGQEQLERSGFRQIGEIAQKPKRRRLVFERLAGA